MQKRLVTRYAMRSAEAADENRGGSKGSLPSWRRPSLTA
jgi:hypothetical protein